MLRAVETIFYSYYKSPNEYLKGVVWEVRESEQLIAVLLEIFLQVNICINIINSKYKTHQRLGDLNSQKLAALDGVKMLIFYGSHREFEK